jgi:virginiamycin A acetyltransferase
LNKIIFYLYGIRNRHFRRIIKALTLRLENGEMYSVTLRKIYSVYHQVEIGLYSYGCFDEERFASNTSIGRYCSFGKNVFRLSGNHPLQFKSSHPFFYNPALKVCKELLINRTKITILNDVWIGNGTIILPQVTRIGNGVVIGAGSIVSKNVPDYAVVAGNPARIIKYRFERSIIDELLNSNWWDKRIEEISSSIDKLNEFQRRF